MPQDLKREVTNIKGTLTKILNVVTAKGVPVSPQSQSMGDVDALDALSASGSDRSDRRKNAAKLAESSKELAKAKEEVTTLKQTVK